MKLNGFELQIKKSKSTVVTNSQKLGVEIVTNHHVEMFLTIQRKHDKATVREYLSIFTAEAAEKIKLLASKHKTKNRKR
jgi:hypothetical protein